MQAWCHQKGATDPRTRVTNALWVLRVEPGASGRVASVSNSSLL